VTEAVLELPVGRSVVDSRARSRLGKDQHLSDYGDARLLALPVWSIQFCHRGGRFSCFVNGQTGQVSGRRPFSAIKTACAVGLPILVVAGALVGLLDGWRGDDLAASVADGSDRAPLEFRPVDSPASPSPPTGGGVTATAAPVVDALNVRIDLEGDDRADPPAPKIPESVTDMSVLEAGDVVGEFVRSRRLSVESHANMLLAISRLADVTTGDVKAESVLEVLRSHCVRPVNREDFYAACASRRGREAVE